MLPGRPPAIPRQYLTGYQTRDVHRVRVPWDSLVTPEVPPGTWLAKGQRVGTAVCLDDPRRLRLLRAPIDGILVNAGSASSVAAGPTNLGFRKADILAPVASGPWSLARLLRRENRAGSQEGP